MNGGAVAYLTHSPYGRNGNEITINDSKSYHTGNAGNSVSSASPILGIRNAYNTTAGMLASTTGNITGIYDMSGGAKEYVAGWNKNSSYLGNGSSFASQGGSSTKYATAYNADNSYVPSSSRCILGDATYEVYVSNNQAWFSDSSHCIYYTYYFTDRGNYYEENTSAGIFSSSGGGGGPSGYLSFRMCLSGK